MSGALRWGIVGVGIAGRARARAMARMGASLEAVYRGRFADETGAPQVGELSALWPLVDAVVISSPSAHHEDHVRQALEAGCHVVCEYPLAETAAGAEVLFALARARDRVLHVEHIERLSATTEHLASALSCRDGVYGRMHFDAHGAPWPDGPSHGWGNISRLHRLEAVLGRVRGWDITRADGERIEGVIALARGSVEIAWARRPSLRRGMRWELNVGDERWLLEGRSLWRDGAPVELAPTRLFERDLEIALGRIVRGAESYVQEEAIVRMIALGRALGGGGRWSEGAGSA